MLSANTPSAIQFNELCSTKKIPVFGLNPGEMKLTDDISAHVAWAFKHIYQFPYPHDLKEPKEIARLCHGIQHVSRVAMYIPSLANLYRRHGDEQALHLDNEDIQLLQISALFHDAARENELIDKWDEESALFLYFYLTMILNISDSKAQVFAEAVANKDAEKKYRMLTIFSLTGSFIFADSPPRKKSIYQKLIHDADCLDIIRARDHFDAAYLDFYQDIAKNNAQAFEEMAKLIIEVRSIIEVQGDGRMHADKKIKKLYEHENAYEALLKTMLANDNINDDTDNPKNNYRILPRLYGGGKLLFDKMLHCELLKQYDPDAEKGSIEYLRKALSEGRVLARSISTPSAVSEKNVSLARLEILKILRRPDIPTQARKEWSRLGKLGNPNRSVSVIGLGASVLAAAGFLIIDPDLKKLKMVSNCDFSSGRAKKKQVSYPFNPNIKEDIAKLLTLQKMGGGSTRFGDRIATHNEGICDITEYHAVYFTQDCTLYDMSLSHRYSPILQAIFLQNEYAAATGIKLPIYEYSGSHDFIKERQYDYATIKNMWVEMCCDYFKSLFYYELFTISVEDLQINAMYGSKYNDFAKCNAPADSNYEKHMRDEIKISIQKEQKLIVGQIYENLLKDIPQSSISTLDSSLFFGIFNFPELLSSSEIVKKIIFDIRNEKQIWLKGFFPAKYYIVNGFCIEDENIINLHNDKEKVLHQNYFQFYFFKDKQARIFYLSRLLKLTECSEDITQQAKQFIQHKLSKLPNSSYKDSDLLEIIFFSQVFDLFDFIKTEVLKSGILKSKSFANKNKRAYIQNYLLKLGFFESQDPLQIQAPIQQPQQTALMKNSFFALGVEMTAAIKMMNEACYVVPGLK